MIIHRLTALAIVAVFSTVLRVSVIPMFDRIFGPVEGDFSILIADPHPEAVRQTVDAA